MVSENQAYFSDSLTQEAIQALKTAGLVMEERFGIADGVTGVLFGKVGANEVLMSVGLEIVSTKNSLYDGINFVVLKKVGQKTDQNQPGQVQIEFDKNTNWGDTTGWLKQAAMDYLAPILAPEIQKIVFYHHHDDFVELFRYQNQDTIFRVFWGRIADGTEGVVKIVECVSLVGNNMFLSGDNVRLSGYNEMTERVRRELKLATDRMKKPDFQQYVELRKNVVAHGRFSSSDNFIDAIIQKLLKKSSLIKRVEMHYEKTVQPGKEMKDTLVVCLFAGLGQNHAASVKVPQKIFGRAVSCLKHCGHMSSEMEEGIVFMDGDYAVAEFIGNTLYVFHHLGCQGDKHETEIFCHLLGLVEGELTKPEEQKAVERDARRRAILERSREQYADMCRERYRIEVESLQRLVGQMSEQAVEFRKKYIEAVREMEFSEQKLVVLSQSGKPILEKYRAEFDQMTAWPNVRMVQTDNQGILTVMTDVLFATDPRSQKVHEIGEFKIVINVKNGDIRWYNQTRLVVGYDGIQFNAPHVRENGAACLGNASGPIAEMVARHEFSALVALAIQFVETVNVDPGENWGPFIDKWPTVGGQPEKEKRKPPKKRTKK